jgi:hypothetical protein
MEFFYLGAWVFLGHLQHSVRGKCTLLVSQQTFILGLFSFELYTTSTKAIILALIKIDFIETFYHTVDTSLDSELLHILISVCISLNVYTLIDSLLR